jgi:hypothetical protein
VTFAVKRNGTYLVKREGSGSLLAGNRNLEIKLFIRLPNLNHLPGQQRTIDHLDGVFTLNKGYMQKDNDRRQQQSQATTSHG